MLRTNGTGDLLPRLEAVLEALEKSVLPRRNGLGSTFRSDKVSPLVKELANLVRQGIEAGLWEPDILSYEFYQTFGTKLGMVYQSSAKGEDRVWHGEVVACPHCSTPLLSPHVVLPEA